MHIAAIIYYFDHFIKFINHFIIVILHQDF
jgi:hypothetical protein